jgi:hypothetical protein
MTARNCKLAASKIAIWTLITPLFFAFIAYMPLVQHAMHDPRHDANEIVDPLSFILSFLTPIAFIGIVGLCILWRCDFAKGSVFFAALVLFVVCTFSLIAFGIYGFYGTELYFSDVVWWLKPFKLFGM